MEEKKKNEVGKDVALNPITPEDVLRKLVKDEDLRVREVPAGKSSKKKTP